MGAERKKKSFFLKTITGEFPSSPVVKLWCFHCWVLGSIPAWVTKKLQGMRRGQKDKTSKTWRKHNKTQLQRGICFDFPEWEPMSKTTNSLPQESQGSPVRPVSEVWFSLPSLSMVGKRIHPTCYPKILEEQVLWFFSPILKALVGESRVERTLRNTCAICK